MQLIPILTSSLFAAAAFGADVAVQVGGDAGENVFLPTTIMAEVGDNIVFTWHTGRHSVIESDFSNPCNPKSAGIFSGSVTALLGEGLGQAFAVPVLHTNPIWLYSGQSQDCQSGMVAVINPPSGGNNLDTYKANAKNAKTSIPSGGISGGFLISLI
ncbi:MAG: hypothetical protein M1839_005213 [Geoglossum umbratile]|nr:MAG: hypothetical protein M1839_005213 [Geoglossum umbratile]